MSQNKVIDISKDGNSFQIIVTRGSSNSQIITSLIKMGIEHFIQHNSLNSIDNEIEIARIMNEAPELLLEKPLTSFLDPYKLNESNDADFLKFTKVLDDVTKHHSYVDEVESKLIELGIKRSQVPNIVLAGDEMITNALNHGFPTNGQQRPPLFKIGASEKSVILVSQDFEGTLNLKSLMDKFHQCYIRGVGNQINYNANNGAGIGAFLIFENSPAFYAFVKKNETTIIASAFLKRPRRNELDLPKTAHFHEWSDRSSLSL